MHIDYVLMLRTYAPLILFCKAIIVFLIVVFDNKMMSTNSARVLGFTQGLCHPVRDGASQSQNFFLKIQNTAGKILNKIGLPGIIKPTEITDNLSGTEIKIRTGNLFTIISVNEREFYFTRITGQFAGTGSSMV